MKCIFFLLCLNVRFHPSALFFAGNFVWLILFYAVYCNEPEQESKERVKEAWKELKKESSVLQLRSWVVFSKEENNNDTPWKLVNASMCTPLS